MISEENTAGVHREKQSLVGNRLRSLYWKHFQAFSTADNLMMCRLLSLNRTCASLHSYRYNGKYLKIMESINDSWLHFICLLSSFRPNLLMYFHDRMYSAWVHI